MTELLDERSVEHATRTLYIYSMAARATSAVVARARGNAPINHEERTYLPRAEPEVNKWCSEGLIGAFPSVKGDNVDVARGVNAINPLLRDWQGEQAKSTLMIARENLVWTKLYTLKHPQKVGFIKM